MRPLYLLALLAIAFAESQAQSGPAAFPRLGTVVRVTALRGDTAVGLMTRLTTDSVWLADLRFSRADLSSVAIQKRNHGKGALRGLKIGAAIGGLMIAGGAIADASAGPCREFICVPAVAVGAFLGVVTTGVGTVVGAAIGRQEWQPVK